MEDIDCKLPENMEMDECMDMMDKDMDDGMSKDMMPQLEFAMGALMQCVSYSALFFRYRGDSMDYYTYGDQYLGTDSMNWWKMANSASLPAGAAIMGILFLTQVLSMAGIAGEINMMAWMYGLRIWMVTAMVGHVLRLVGYEMAYSWYAEDTTNNAAGATMMYIIGSESYKMVAKETAAFMGLYFASEKWFKGQVMMLPEEQQEKWIEMHGGKKHDDHDDHDDDMEFSLNAFFGF